MSNGITESIVEKIILFNNSSIPVVIMDLDGNFINSNNPFNKMVSNCKIENIKELLDESAVEMWNEYMGITKEKGKFTFFMPLQVKSKIIGTYKMESIYCDCNKTITISLNLKKELKNRNELSYKGAFNTSDSLMILVDEHGIVRDINDKCFHYLNFDRSHFVNKPVDVLINMASKDDQTFSEYTDGILGNEYTEVLIKYEKTPGNVCFYHIVTRYDKQIGYYLTQVTDQTVQINLEEQLEHNNALSSVGQLAASIAHEIRNPMTTLKGFTQLLRISASEESKRYLSVIDDEIERMESILGEMLILSKPSKNKKELISIQSLMSDLVQVIEPKARLAGITIIKKVDLLIKSMIYGDVVKLKQALFNVLKNALEAMPSDGLLTIEIKEVGEEVISVSIQDTGKGIKDSQLPQIFRPYFTTRADGTGLGLSFVLKTIENHGGTISVESKVGIGSKFIILFPVAIGYTTAINSTNLSISTLYD
ncbi:ATP-binding protein [Sporosarcina siberiensis]|uniref:histidine kinase n=1 Tax=Sporosarcina siberiensis TaxID=1365606 RepID=A0ABW4SHT4_9BACL